MLTKHNRPAEHIPLAASSALAEEVSDDLNIVGRTRQQDATTESETSELSPHPGLIAALIVCSISESSTWTTMSIRQLLALATAGVAAATLADATSAPVTLLFQNNLNSTDNHNHIGALLLGPLLQADAQTACHALSEELISEQSIRDHEQDFLEALSYHAYAGRASSEQSYLIGGNKTIRVSQSKSIQYQQQEPNCPPTPVICSQSVQSSEPGTSAATPANQVVITDSKRNNYTGFRNQKSFRFLGIPYATTPKRFEYSTIQQVEQSVINATAYGPTCTSSEDCLYLNIQTPYLPRSDVATHLRPVVLWIHGGEFIGGSGSDADYDGGNLASREDLVTVSINYRLGPLGFLAVPNTTTRGNFGIGDQETAIQWTVENIAAFGGDPEQLTIMGQSAGAQSVRAILGSPPAMGKFRAAVVLSNVGPMTLSPTPSTEYPSIESAFKGNNGTSLLEQAGCPQTDLQAAVDCLQTVERSMIGGVAPQYALVQDGYYINSPQLNVARKGGQGSVANVPVIFGNVQNDGASFISRSFTNFTSVTAGVQSLLSINESFADAIVASYPADNAGVVAQAFNMSQRALTDRAFRCFNQATLMTGVTTGAFKSNSYYYEFTRTEGGLNFGNLPGAPVEPGFPYGNPELPYYKLHASEFDWVFGNRVQLRDANDLYSQQQGVSYFASFIKSGNPNADPAYLDVRGYDRVSQGLQTVGSWKSATSTDGNVAILNYPPSTSRAYLAEQRCARLGVPLDHLLR